ncbi:putative bifunctional diguanylate cyclase/phosphodiesterase [Solicola sp. PLA-1-18]|uniref:putative bifunctional diguanylate cyclase/phosphodiesterase n=1 Tax=Solicola sp. PLA-1-18 TaxID=3380532 RepID=UPI003B7E0847
MTTEAVRPFALCAALGVLTLALPPYDLDLETLSLAGIAMAAVVAAVIVLPWRRWPAWTDGIAPMALFGVVATVREGAGGGSAGLGALVVLPVLWLALHGTRRQLQASGLAVVLVFVGPLLVEGVQARAVGEWRQAAVWLAVVWTVAPVVQELARRSRERADRRRGPAGEAPGALVPLLDGDLDIVVAGAVAPHDDRAPWCGPGLEGASTPQHTVLLAPDLPAVPGCTDVDAAVPAHDAGDAPSSEREVLALRHQVEQLVEEAPTGICVASSDGIVTRANPALCAILGRARADLVGRPLEGSGLLGPRSWPQVVDDLGAGDGRGDSWETEVADGERAVDLLVQAALLESPDGASASLLLHVVDVSERRRFERRLDHLAGHDPLTGLANRRKFDQVLADHLVMCRRYGPRGSLLMIDLDRFKDVNDALGHGAGDQLIVAVGELFRRELRDTDLVARLGGDEFAVLLPEQSVEEATTVAERLVRLVREELATFDPQLPGHVTASIGLLVLNDPDATPAEVMSTADLTMYDAKDAGRDRVVVFDGVDAAMPRSGTRLCWTTRLRRAVEEDRFVLHAQPVVDLHTRRLESVEMLIRLRGDDGGLVMPDRFLGIAERIGLSARIDLWVLQQALDVLKQPDGPPRVAVNVSARSLDAADFLRRTIEMIEAGGPPRGRLTIELTETAAIASMHRARDFAEAVRHAGCWLALDDFGAGYGSFYYFKHLPFDAVKIDGEFVRGALEEATDRSIIRAVVSVAHDLGGVVVAEHVPDEDTAVLLTELGVDYGQGYYFGRPEPL